MYDGASLSEPVLLPAEVLQRAVGDLRVSVRRRGTETVLDDLRQAGCLKARFPRRIVPGWMDIVMLNTGGGVAAGDRLDVTIDLGGDAQATIAAQAAERFYRARRSDRPSRVHTRLTAAQGAALEWLPQETILFDQSMLTRRLDVDLASDARFLSAETIVFGRTAMGERVGQGTLRDLIRVTRDGELLLHDAIRIDGDIDATLRRPAIGGGARVVATIVYAAADTAERLPALRSVLHPAPMAAGATPPTGADAVVGAQQPPTACAVEAAASAWNGILVARVLGPDSASVRRAVIAALTVLRDDRPLPRVWLC